MREIRILTYEIQKEDPLQHIVQDWYPETPHEESHGLIVSNKEPKNEVRWREDRQVLPKIVDQVAQVPALEEVH